jgi:DNA primase
LVSLFETIREHVDIVAVADRHLDLARSGSVMKCRCPYADHDDENPSFCVYPDGRFFCYGCGRHGDVVDLWSVVKGLQPGVEAALDLAQEHGVCLPESDSEIRRKLEKRRDTEARNAAKAQEAHERLSRHPGVVAWWDARGFCEELRKRFMLGTNEDGTEALIPFWSRGRVQGLIRRKLEGEPKYVLPRAEEFPNGRRPLFVPGRTRGAVFLVEGYVDALVLVALGFDAVAVGGTCISKHQVDELRALTGPIYILPDNDESGEEAARQWVDDLYPNALLCPSSYEKEITE